MTLEEAKKLKKENAKLKEELRSVRLGYSSRGVQLNMKDEHIKNLEAELQRTKFYALQG